MITHLHIDNFRSLRNTQFNPPKLSFLCGPNGSGKTNLAEALDFLSNTFGKSLSYAVAEKGGFYNMCFRRQRRSRGAIFFRINGTRHLPRKMSAHYEVSFSLQTKTEAIRSDFYVETEDYIFDIRTEKDTSFRVRISRKGEEYKFEIPESLPEEMQRHFGALLQLDKLFGDFLKPTPQELLYPGRLSGFFPVDLVLRDIQSARVFRISPRFASEAGTPSIAGELGKYGQNLPSAVDHMRVNDKKTFARLEQWVKHVVPDLDYLTTDYTPSKEMGLWLKEKGFGTQWYAQDLSDGTLMSIALFLAVLDRRHSLILIEEPENSLHPWIIKTFLECCRVESENKQVLLTTQSPLVVSQAQPEQLFLVERENGETGITPAKLREPALDEIINTDFLDLGDYWLSGGLKAVPAPPTVQDEKVFHQDK